MHDEQAVSLPKHYLVEGTVQGVGFRRFVERVAKDHRIRGAVRNLQDGRVEIIATGEIPSMTEFEKLISRGPSHSYVRQISSKDLPTEDVPTLVASALASKDFEVFGDGEVPWYQS